MRFILLALMISISAFRAGAAAQPLRAIFVESTQNPWTPEQKESLYATLASLDLPALHYFWGVVSPQREIAFIKSDIANASYDSSLNRINIGIRFFNQPTSEVPRTILHELAHAFDHLAPSKLRTSRSVYTFSSSEEFLSLYGWTRSSSTVTGWDLPMVSEQARMAEVNKFKSSKSDDRFKNFYEAGRIYGFPSAYAMMKPSECFAELVSLLYLDEQTRSAIDPRIANWIYAVTQGQR